MCGERDEGDGLFGSLRTSSSETWRTDGCGISGRSRELRLLRLQMQKRIARPASRRAAIAPPTLPPMIAPLLESVLSSGADVDVGSIARVGVLAAYVACCWK